MKNIKTTIAGALLAALVAVEPLISGAGYHLDKPTIIRVSIAACIAVLAYFTKDADNEQEN